MVNINANVNIVNKSAGGAAVVYKSIVSVETFSNVLVDEGSTNFENLALPTDADVVLSDASGRTLNILLPWQGSYNKDVAGTYPLEGSLQLPADVNNPSFLKAMINVIVQLIAPSNLTIPVITGTAKVGNTLSASTGTWSGNDITYTYQWKRGGVNIGGATASTYLLTSTDYNTVITVQVTATNARGSANATSSGTASVLPANPVNSVLPAITGDPFAGSVLTVSNGTWTAQGSLSYTYQWYKNGVAISGQTNNTYTVQIEDQEESIYARVVATNAGGSSSPAQSNTVIISETTPFASNLLIGDESDHFTIDYDYTSPVAEAEAIQKPVIIEDIVLSGDFQEDEVGIITIKYKNNSRYAFSSADIKIYKANDIRGGSEALSATVSGGNITVIDDETIQATYTWVTGEVGKYITVQASVTLNGGTQPTSDTARSAYTYDTVEAAVVVGGITYFGSASNPADNGTLAASPVAVTPPASMQTGDLVIIVANSRTASSTLTMSVTGGQTWNALTNEANATNNACRAFWCRFNGTWAADPSVAMSGSVLSNTVVMHVFRPSNGANTWEIDVAMTSLQNVAPTVGSTFLIAGITTIAASTVSFAIWSSADDNTWGNLTGAWEVTGAAQYRNQAGSDISLTFAHKIRTSTGTTGDVTKDQLALGPDNCITQIVAFKEIP